MLLLQVWHGYLGLDRGFLPFPYWNKPLNPYFEESFMKKFLLLFLFVTALFFIGCDGKDGETGVTGVTGTGGCDFDQVFDKDTGICILNADYEAPVGCDFDQVFDKDTGICIVNADYEAPVDGADADLTSVQEYIEANCESNDTDSTLACAAP